MVNYTLILLFLSIPIIAFVDYLLFCKWLRCDKCFHEINKWYAFIIPTFIEVLLFLFGIAIGYYLK